MKNVSAYTICNGVKIKILKDCFFIRSTNGNRIWFDADGNIIEKVNYKKKNRSAIGEKVGSSY